MAHSEEIIVTAPLFVIDVYLASDSYTLGKPRLYMVEVFSVQGSYSRDTQLQWQRSDRQISNP